MICILFTEEIPDKATGLVELKPVVCCVCDGTPTEPQWAEWIDLSSFTNLCHAAHLHKTRLLERGVYKEELINSYTVPMFANLMSIFSHLIPWWTKTHNLIFLACKQCHSELLIYSKQVRNNDRRQPPKQAAIANGYLLGKALQELLCLNEVEKLALVSHVKVHMQCWTFFAGCHKQIAVGTFFPQLPYSKCRRYQTLARKWY